jgi:uridine kinase
MNQVLNEFFLCFFSYLDTKSNQKSSVVYRRRASTSDPSMYIIGITGLSCSGKTTLSERLQARLGGPDRCLLISMDDYYKELTKEEYAVLHDDDAAVNFDTPAALDFDLLRRNLAEIRQGEANVRLPRFDLATCVIAAWRDVPPRKYKYVVLEGLFVFSDPHVASLCNLKVWVETGEYVCALRRFIKFTYSIKGYTHDYVYNQCVKYVIPGQEMFVKPVKKCCDFFINGEKDTVNYVDMIVRFVEGQDQEKKVDSN